MTTSKSFDISKLTPAARKDYNRGLGLIALKMRGKAHQPSYEERHAAATAEGKKILAAKLSPNGYRKAFGVPPPAPAPKPPVRTTATTRKTFTVGPVVRHRYAVRGGLIG